MKISTYYSRLKKNLFPLVFLLGLEVCLVLVEERIDQIRYLFLLMAIVSFIASNCLIAVDEFEIGIGITFSTFSCFIPLAIYRIIFAQGYDIELKYFLYMYVVLIVSQVLGYLFFSFEWKKQKKIATTKKISLGLIEGFPFVFISILLRRSFDNSNMSVETKLWFLVIGLMILMVFFSVIGIAYLSAPFKGVRMRIVDGASVVTFEADNEK